MNRETVKADKAALKKEYHTVLEIMRRALDTGQENEDANSQSRTLFAEFRTFA